MSVAGSAVDVVVVGGGIAGLSVAVALAPHARVLLLERAPSLASYASGHNAAIYRPLEDDATSAHLAQRSLAIMSELIGTQVLSRSGLLLVSDDAARMQQLAAHAAAAGVSAQLLDTQAASAFEPSLAQGQARAALRLLDGGVLDIHALTDGFARVARARGAQLRTGASVARIELGTAADGGGVVRSVLLADGERVSCQHVVICAGAWSSALGLGCGAELDLVPMRRHLVSLRSVETIGHERPVVWRLEDELYYRPESGGLLASPCDETPWLDPDHVPSDPSALITLGQKLARLAPSYADAVVRRSWACLRTFARDRELVAGPDRRIAGLHWLSGLGGRGMSTGPAAGELVAQCLLTGAQPPAAAPLAPERLYMASSAHVDRPA